MKHLLKQQFSDNSNIFRSLLSVYGIGYTNAVAICNKFAIHKNMLFKSLNQKRLDRLNFYLNSNFITELDLRRSSKSYFDIHKKNGSYKGLRFKQGLPSNGQRTHTNAKTVKRIFRPKRSRIKMSSIKKSGKKK